MRLPPGLAANERPALITFDDGFLDNYVHGWPLLKKHGHKGIIFAVTGKLESGEPRPTMEDVWRGKIAQTDLPRVDAPMLQDSLGYERREDHFLNWQEIRRMEESGVISVQAHSHHHASVFLSNDYDGFYTPGPRNRTFDRIQSDIPWGMPCFKEGPALANQAFIPSEDLLQLLSWELPKSKTACDAYLKDPGKVQRLEKVLHSMPLAKWGRIEEPEEFRQRVRLELTQCRDAFVQHVGAAPPAIAWPWGKYVPETLEIAKELGFELFFATSMGANPPGATNNIHRFKAKPKPPAWMAQRLAIYSRAWLAQLYAKMRI